MHTSPVLTLLLQLAVVLGVCRLVGAIAVRANQPRVVGEMVAGILLGPSLLGWLFPAASAFLFPAGSEALLNVLAQIGVILFLFLVGLELDPKLLRSRGPAALIISHMSIVVPFLGGAMLTLFLYPIAFNNAPSMRFTAAALFIGAAMSITAFPVLARVLSERRMLRTNIGALAITCAAIDDVTAWCMLAFVLGIARAEGLGSGIVTAVMVALYAGFMLVLVRPALRRLEVIHEKYKDSSNTVLAIVLLLVLLSSAITEFIGIHALFGAFFLGAIMPKESAFVRATGQKLEDFVIAFLLPVFFAYTGLRTQIGLLDNAYLWGLTGLVIFTACLGKFGGSLLAGRITGLGWREAAAIGILMNTRGLMELVILTIGLQMGVITDAVFAMMVLMALVTTAMTTPILSWVYPRRLLPEEATVDDATAQAEFGVLIPVARPQTGPPLIHLLSLLGSDKGRQTKLYALSLTRISGREILSGQLPQSPAKLPDSLAQLMNEAAQRGIATEPITFPSRDVASDISRVARAKKVDLILLGFHKSVLGEGILGGTVHRVLTGSDADVAVFVDRGLPARPRVLVPYQGLPHDHLGLELASLLARHSGLEVTILHVLPPHDRSDVEAELASLKALPDTVKVLTIHHPSPIEAMMQHASGHDLAIIGLDEEWGLRSRLFGFRAERIATDWPGSLLMVRKHMPHETIAPPSGAGALAATADQPH